jgi:hypothetical protein
MLDIGGCIRVAPMAHETAQEADASATASLNMAANESRQSPIRIKRVDESQANFGS